MKTCSSCGQSIANNAAACPHCGKRFTTPITWLAIGAVIVVAILIVIGAMIRAGH